MGAQDQLNKKNRTFFTLDDIKDLFAKCGYRDPYIFHWFSVPCEEDRDFIKKLMVAGNDKREYLYTTYLFTVKVFK